MREKFLDALTKSLEKNVFESYSQLSEAAGLNRSITTRIFKKLDQVKKGEISSDDLKLNFSLDTVFKIVDALGGVLVFPWDKDDDDTIYMKAGKLEEELATAKNEIAELKIELKTCKEISQRFENIIRDKMPSYTEMPAASRQDKKLRVLKVEMRGNCRIIYVAFINELEQP